MDIGETAYCASREEWRRWLAEHHDSCKGVWLIYYKKGMGMPGVPYDDAVEEALCYGWIDSTIRKIDEEKYARKFTPRKAGSRWSELNVRRVERLSAAGRMTDAGLSKFGKPGDRKIARIDKNVPPPPDLLEALESDARAWEFYQRLATSHKNDCHRWINDAKRDETRQRRIGEAVELMARGKTLKDKWFK